ncbi:glucans biosynthesis glucosyltransferase MdoH [Hyphomonas pacifica]|uniref:glucans biosynthesis glucosyltransferase MdoH n=1 Tax=Hyphomonas pacifica TaxID=1280941 RepID=UPI000DBFBE6A|nr:glucans biosynthesis glucosyltransferase MdoH [Hyphomonas pacifica]RAN36229.1 hypothetical protein HY11_12450 [Hyphomonas pacifica]
MTDLRPRPTEFPLTMPNQAFKAQEGRRKAETPSYRWRKLFVFFSSMLLTLWATREMYEVLAASEMTLLEWVLLVVFVINISWICFAFINATIGFVGALSSEFRGGGEEPDICIHNVRTVIAFPIYNESVEHVFATVSATARMLKESPGIYECFILSDTTDPEIALAEEAAYTELLRTAGHEVAVRYRRRTINHHRKSGNVRDFVMRWGGRYDYMIVFDADSYMERDTIVRLVKEMERAPHTALIQTIPQLVGGTTLFARCQQFASALYGPILGGGMAWWAQNEGNFWGHNAIIRVSALAEAAGLPDIPGKAPFGGTILSHDFVEAAFLRRAGWNVEIRPEIGGSYEQGPPTIIELVKRDRRWCQGNMQHMAVLLKTAGLSWTNRFHLITGIFSYLASPLWLIFITLGMMLSLQNSFMRPNYFSDGASLFPTWPVIDSERALTLFLATMGLLFAPKIYALIYGLVSSRWRKTVGVTRTFMGTLTETFISVLIAPILMATQTGAVINVFRGKDTGWSPQERSQGGYGFLTTLRHNAPATLLGLVLTVSAIAISPIYAAWLAPATIGMLLSAPLSYWTAKESVGRAAHLKGLLVTPVEINTPESVQLSKAESATFATLPKTDTVSLLRDRRKQKKRKQLIDPYWPLQRYEVHTPLAIARAKAARVLSLEDYMKAITRAELMAVLNSSQDMESISFRFSVAGRVVGDSTSFERFLATRRTPARPPQPSGARRGRS